METFAQHSGRQAGADQPKSDQLKRAQSKCRKPTRVAWPGSGIRCGGALAFVLAWMLIVPGNAPAQGTKAGAKTDATPPGNVEKGKKIFASHACSGCHGSEGQGATGPRISPPPLPLSGFVRYVRQPVGLMPPFNSEAISDSELADVYAFLKSAAPPHAASEAAPAGNVENGKKLFTSDGCYECHGFEGQGAQQTSAPTIGPPPLPFEAFAKYVHQPTGSMPPYTAKILPDAELADIYAYLKSIPPPPQPKSIPLLNQ